MHSSTYDKRRRAEALIRKLDPGYKQRWELYDGILASLTGHGVRWLDAGCGDNRAIEEFPCDLNIGMDIYRHPEVLHDAPNHFLIGTLDSLPFPDNSLSLITLNMVVEHIRHPSRVFAELYRVLEPGGHVLIHTTNMLSPLIFLGKLVPESLRNQLFTRVLGAKERDVFPAHHRINTLSAFRKLEGFETEQFHAVQDINWTNRAVFLALLTFHMLTKLPGFWRFKTNLVVLLKKIPRK